MTTSRPQVLSSKPPNTHCKRACVYPCPPNSAPRKEKPEGPHEPFAMWGAAGSLHIHNSNTTPSQPCHCMWAPEMLLDNMQPPCRTWDVCILFFYQESYNL